jgi:hypothetical protein
MGDFEVIAVFNFTHEIIVIKHRLEQEGIAYFFGYVKFVIFQTII